MIDSVLVEGVFGGAESSELLPRGVPGGVSVRLMVLVVRWTGKKFRRVWSGKSYAAFTLSPTVGEVERESLAISNSQGYDEQG